MQRIVKNDARVAWAAAGAAGADVWAILCILAWTSDVPWMFFLLFLRKVLQGSLKPSEFALTGFVFGCFCMLWVLLDVSGCFF